MHVHQLICKIQGCKLKMRDVHHGCNGTVLNYKRLSWPCQSTYWRLNLESGLECLLFTGSPPASSMHPLQLRVWNSTCLHPSWEKPVCILQQSRWAFLLKSQSQFAVCWTTLSRAVTNGWTDDNWWDQNLDKANLQDQLRLHRTGKTSWDSCFGLLDFLLHRIQRACSLQCPKHHTAF